MKKFLVLQHSPSDRLGIIEPLLQQRGGDYDYVRSYESPSSIPATMEGSSALIVLGGSMGAYEEEEYSFLRAEMKLICNALEAGTPILGICLGAQMLAKASGGKVYPAPKGREIGYLKARLTPEGLRDPLFQGFGDSFTVLIWHGDTFDLPAAATRLAYSDMYPNQAFRLGGKVYGFQFHAEATEELVQEWIEKEKENLAEARVDPELLLAETRKKLQRVAEKTKLLFSRFIDLVG